MMTESSKVEIQHPDFFIIGAPKSGTTALGKYLSEHPQVLFSKPKEPHFFNDDLSYRDITTMDEYLRCFEHGRGDEKAVGEGSTLYLFSQTAVPNITRAYPEAKFIVMLRNPIDAAQSAHWQAMISVGENIRDFRDAWKAQYERQKGDRIPKANRVREALQYGELFRYAGQLERLFDTVSREQVLILLYDDFKRETAKSYARVLQFLDLDQIELDAYPVVNQSKRPRSLLVTRLIGQSARLKKKLGISRSFGVLNTARGWNTARMERPELPVDFRSELRSYFRDDIDRTAVLIGRDLSGWK